MSYLGARGVDVHESTGRLLQNGVCYDLNLGNIVREEQAMREVMTIEERYKDRAGGNKGSDLLNERALFARHEMRVNLCINPALVELKERRKAREASNLMKPD